MKGGVQKGFFIISLDFELYWGRRDKIPLETYRENLLGVRTVVPLLLEAFAQHRIHATWATVGLLFFETRDGLIEGLPRLIPNYENQSFSIYKHLENIGSNERDDPFHYAPSLIRLIASHPDQEIGTHTFSHYYCLEKGQDKDTFRSDLEASGAVAEKYNLTLQSLVFPRNQYNSDYLDICREMGIKAYRGVQPSWFYRAIEDQNESIARRGLRLLDSYFNISGHNCYSIDEIKREFPFNIPASRFLRPYSRKLKGFDDFRLKRIVDDLNYAAMNGLVYHLWWHPHNFGTNIDENIMFLERIMNHFEGLREAYGMQSLNMRELADYLL